MGFQCIIGSSWKQLFLLVQLRFLFSSRVYRDRHCRCYIRSSFWYTLMTINNPIMIQTDICFNTVTMKLPLCTHAPTVLLPLKNRKRFKVFPSTLLEFFVLDKLIFLIADNFNVFSFQARHKEATSLAPDIVLKPEGSCICITRQCSTAPLSSSYSSQVPQYISVSFVTTYFTSHVDPSLILTVYNTIFSLH